MRLSKYRANNIENKIREARRDLLREKPFFGILLMYLKYVAVDNIRNISTNGRCIYISPDFVDKLNPGEVKYVLCHQIMHIINGDIWREYGLAGDEYHRAFDIYENVRLKQFDWKHHGLTHLGKIQDYIPGYHDSLENLSVEQIYEMLPFSLCMLDERSRNRYMFDSDFWWDYKEDEGSEGIVVIDVPKMIKRSKGSTISDEDAETFYFPNNGEGLKRAWRGKIRQAKQAAEAMDKGDGKLAGSVPNNIKRELDERSEPVLDWRQLLNEFVQEEITDYSFSPPDRRFSECDFFLPDFNETEFIPKNILFMADTSGSICHGDLIRVFSEIEGAIEQFNGKIEGKLGFFDCAVTDPIPFCSAEELAAIIPYGGGGTDFCIIFDYVKEKMMEEPPSAIIIFTDGEAEFPLIDPIPSIPTLWLINNNRITPPWGRVARVPSCEGFDDFYDVV